MLILILIDAQYLQNDVLSIKKGSDVWNQSSSEILRPIKKSQAAPTENPDLYC